MQESAGSVVPVQPCRGTLKAFADHCRMQAAQSLPPIAFCLLGTAFFPQRCAVSPGQNTPPSFSARWRPEASIIFTQFPTGRELAGVFHRNYAWRELDRGIPVPPTPLLVANAATGGQKFPPGADSREARRGGWGTADRKTCVNSPSSGPGEPTKCSLRRQEL